MTIQECYDRIGGSYDDIKRRLPTDALIEKFLGKFLSDGSYGLLANGMSGGDRETAFRGAHTLKGVCANLSFSKLYDSSSRLTEVLRSSEEIPADADALMSVVSSDYERVILGIKAYFDEK